MNIGIKQISVSFLFVISVTDAFASPGWRGEGWDFARAFQLNRFVGERAGDLRNEPQLQGQADRRRTTEYESQESSGNGNPGNNSAIPSPESSRKQSRLTPEERRTLRRQIDEAGHDIYRRRQ